eukprot:GHVN01035194.1.p1 GENE.GHVN01035194.1~~GHVN01035194.1.p1  ORF type:complete len:309 (-),score=30.86 GHVN01035194.1:641-1567(-)
MLGKEMSDEFMTVVDVTGSGKVSSRALVKAVETTLDERESLLNSREAREGIALVFKTLVSAMLWLVAVFIMLIIIGVDFETIVLSGAAVIASLTVALGVFYTNFFKAALFILLHDPYNHGDRVRVNGGEVLIVEHIRAYTTLFVSVYGKPSIYPNAWLADCTIENESRSVCASFDVQFSLAADTPRSSLIKLMKACERYVNCRPKELVKRSLYHRVKEAQPCAAKTVHMWITHVESWHNWQAVLTSKSLLLEFVVDIAIALGIKFHLPVQPVQVKQVTDDVHSVAPRGPPHLQVPSTPGSPSSSSRFF